ncbi:hypothetical protein LTR86_007573 [Recurvomyces mirabilis]|nr:hypothetical protein LTR86_007573 [Recurvomyces mirabilis]
MRTAISVETEDGLDAKLNQEASELGIDVDLLGSSLDLTSDSTPKRMDAFRISQESVGSRASQSTGFMSTFSETSREQHPPAGRTPYRTSISFRDYDAFVALGRGQDGHSFSSSSPTTPSQSAFSLPLSSPRSSPKRHFRRIRGLSSLRNGWNSSSTSIAEGCPHCPQDSQSQRRAVHKLPCGHRVCTQSLRITIKATTDGKVAKAPSCCNMPIPGSLVEHVTTQTEQTALLERLEQRDEAISLPRSTSSEERPTETGGQARDVTMESRPVSADLQVDAIMTKMQDDLHELANLTRDHDATYFNQIHSDQRDSHILWISNLRAELTAEHESIRKQKHERRELALQELLETQAAAMAEAEDKQVKAEANMRLIHEQARRDNATALKHMEAYCAGVFSTGELHGRPITDQDRMELEKTRQIRQNMDARQESAINVLRGEQSRRMKSRGQRQEKEEQELQRVQKKEEVDLEQQLGSELTQLEELLDDKTKRLRGRWRLQTAIFVRKAKTSLDVMVNESSPSIGWPSCGPVAEFGPEAGMHDTMGQRGFTTGIAMHSTA